MLKDPQRCGALLAEEQREGDKRAGEVVAFLISSSYGFANPCQALTTNQQEGKENNIGGVDENTEITF